MKEEVYDKKNIRRLFGFIQKVLAYEREKQIHLCVWMCKIISNVSEIIKRSFFFKKKDCITIRDREMKLRKHDKQIVHNISCWRQKLDTAQKI